MKYQLKIQIVQGQKWENLWSPDKARVPGTKYGDEVCDILTNELDMPDIPNDVFPEGVKVSLQSL